MPPDPHRGCHPAAIPADASHLSHSVGDRLVIIHPRHPPVASNLSERARALEWERQVSTGLVGAPPTHQYRPVEVESGHQPAFDTQQAGNLQGRLGKHLFRRRIRSHERRDSLQRRVLRGQSPGLLETRGGLGLEAGVRQGQRGETRQAAGRLAVRGREAPRAPIATEQRSQERGDAVPQHRRVLKTHAENGPRAELSRERRWDHGVAGEVLDRQQGVGLGELQPPDRQLVRAEPHGAFEEGATLRVVLGRVHGGDDLRIHVIGVASGPIGAESVAGRRGDSRQDHREVRRTAQLGRRPNNLLGVHGPRLSDRHAHTLSDSLDDVALPHLSADAGENVRKPWAPHGRRENAPPVRPGSRESVDSSVLWRLLPAIA